MGQQLATIETGSIISTSSALVASGPLENMHTPTPMGLAPHPLTTPLWLVKVSMYTAMREKDA